MKDEEQELEFNISVNVRAIDFVYQICDQFDDEIVIDLIIGIDQYSASWEFTKQLADYFNEQMKKHPDNESM